MSEYETVLQAVTQLIRRRRGRGRFKRRNFLSGDLSFTLAGGVGGVSGTAVSQRRRCQGPPPAEWAEKHALWMQLCLSSNLSAWTTDSEARSPQTDSTWGSDTSRGNLSASAQIHYRF